MSQNYLIDGYNLLHAFGLPSGRLGPGGLEKARNRLLGLLAAALENDAAETTIVFDSHHPRPGSKGEEQFEAIHVLYAIQHEEADELMEDLIRRHSSPRQLAVVSDDHRVQRAARRRHCRVLQCGDFLDELESKRSSRPRKLQGEADSKGTQSEEEKARWIKEFGDLDKGPEMRELFGWLDFEE